MADETTSVSKRVHEPGTAPIKPEYLISQTLRAPEPIPTINSATVLSGTDGQEERNGSGEKPSEVKRRKTGQNKARKKATRPDLADKLCASNIDRHPPCMEDRCRMTCKFGEKCKMEHDPTKFWTNRSDDIGEVCPIYDVRGWCRFGASCRFATAHTSEENLEQKFDAEKWDKWYATHPNLAEELNLPPPGVQKTLRNRKYNFDTCKAYLHSLGLLQNNRHSSQNKKMTAAADTPKPPSAETATMQGGEKEYQKQSSFIRVTEDGDNVRLKPSERKKIDWKNKKYLAPLTTVGNLPFRRICVDFGAEITCGEMAVATSLLQGTASEWSLLRRHESEKCFGIQICGGFPDTLMFASRAIAENTEVDFIDLNLGCPIGMICDKGAGCSLMNRLNRLCQNVSSINHALEPLGVPLTLKMRTGLKEGVYIADKLIERIREEPGLRVDLMTLHGRSKEQRYSKLADWDYIETCARVSSPIPFYGCGDILSYEDYYNHLKDDGSVSGIMIARGALIKPWLFTEIDERRHWDITANERLDILKRYVSYGLSHWGSDTEGVEKTRRFLLEWLSFLHRYIPVGLLEVLPQRINEKPPPYFGRNELETKMGSNNCRHWIEITEMLLGPVPDYFEFTPKHVANSYSVN